MDRYWPSWFRCIALWGRYLSVPLQELPVHLMGESCEDVRRTRHLRANSGMTVAVAFGLSRVQTGREMETETDRQTDRETPAKRDREIKVECGLEKHENLTPCLMSCSTAFSTFTGADSRL